MSQRRPGKKGRTGYDSSSRCGRHRKGRSEGPRRRSPVSELQHLQASSCIRLLSPLKPGSHLEQRPWQALLSYAVFNDREMRSSLAPVSWSSCSFYRMLSRLLSPSTHEPSSTAHSWEQPRVCCLLGAQRARRWTTDFPIWASSPAEVDDV